MRLIEESIGAHRVIQSKTEVRDNPGEDKESQHKQRESAYDWPELASSVQSDDGAASEGQDPAYQGEKLPEHALYFETRVTGLACVKDICPSGDDAHQALGDSTYMAGTAAGAAGSQGGAVPIAEWRGFGVRNDGVPALLLSKPPTKPYEREP